MAETWERRVTLGPDLTVSREVEQAVEAIIRALRLAVELEPRVRGQGGYQGSGECRAQGDFGVQAKL